MTGKITECWRRADIKHLSASSLIKTPARWAYDYLYLSYEERRRMPVGEAAALGTVVHGCIQDILCEGESVDEAIKQALVNFDFHDANEDDVKRKKYRQCIEPMVEIGIVCLRDAGFTGSVPEQTFECWLDGIGVPVIGYIDMVQPGTMFVEMKTKAPRKTKMLKSGEQGWSKSSLPKKPEANHVMQSAIYWYALKITPSICYIGVDDAVLFTPFNCDELKADNLKQALSEMHRRALMRQNLLQISADPKVLAGLIEPDWQHPYQWNIGTENYRKAKELWSPSLTTR